MDVRVDERAARSVERVVTREGISDGASLESVAGGWGVAAAALVVAAVVEAAGAPPPRS